MKKIEKEFNVITNMETITEREETLEEKKIREKAETDLKTKEAEDEARAIQRQVILDRLGLTSEEAALLLYE